MGVSSLSGTSWALIVVSAVVVATAAGCYLLARRLASERTERRARYNLYRISGGHLDAVETRVHDPATGAFHPTA